MPGQPTPYEAARARIAARRAGNPRRGVFDSVKDYAVGLRDTVLPTDTVSDVWEGPMYALRHPVDSAKLLYDAAVEGSSQQWQKSMNAPTLSEKLGHGAAALLPFVGPAAADTGEEFAQGNYAKGFGRMTGLLAPNAIAAMRPGPKPAPAPAPSVRAQALLPERAASAPPRFVGGRRGMVDTMNQPGMDTGPVTPGYRQDMGTVMPHERGVTQRVSPDIIAEYSGTGDPMPMRNVPSSAGIDPFRSTQNRAFEALVPERYKSQQNIQPFEGNVVDSPRSAFYPPEDPRPGIPKNFGEFAEVGPIGSAGQLPDAIQSRLRASGLAPEHIARMDLDTATQFLSEIEKAKPVGRGKTPAARTEGQRQSLVSERMNRPGGDPVINDPQGLSSAGRPYKMLSDADLATLAKLNDANAMNEMEIRRLGGPRVTAEDLTVDPTPPRLSVGDRLRDETGAVGRGADDLMRRRAEAPPRGEPGSPERMRYIAWEHGETWRTKQAKLDALKGRDPKSINWGAEWEPDTRVRSFADAQKEIDYFKMREQEAQPSRLDRLINDEGGYIKIPDLSRKQPVDFDAPIDAGGGRGNFFHRTVNPKFDNEFANWVNSRRASKIEGLLKRKEFADLDNRGFQGISEFQAGLKGGRFKDVGDYFNVKHRELGQKGIKLGFRENYLPQLWENSADEVFKVQKRLGLQPSFTLERVLENYQAGIAEGLKPRFKTIGELIGWYEERANKAIADRQFFDDLRANKQILPEGKAPQEWVTLDPDHFPVQKFKTRKGDQVTKLYKAPKPIAEAINNYLGEGHGALRWVGDKSSLTKNIVLSAGIPKTGINAHGFNIAARNVMARGLVKGGTEAVKYLLNPKSAGRWLDENLTAAPEAVKNGLTLTSEEHQIGTPGSVHLLREPKTKVGKVANKGLNLLLSKHGQWFEDPLFQNIVPALKLKHWQGLVDDFSKSGMSPEQARRAAADTTNNLYGGINWEAMQRSRDLQNLLRGIVLAPDWFETQYRIGKGMVNTLRDPHNPRGLPWKRAAANLIAAYVAADVVNYSINGKHMYQNEPGHTLDIRAGEVGGKVRYIRPFGTAADFARLPTDAIVGALKYGDLSTTSQILKNRRATLFKLGTNLGMNVDDFGNPIFGKDKFRRPVPVTTQIGKAAREVADVSTPQYLSGAIDYATGRATSPEEALIGSVEMPVRYSRKPTKPGARRGYRPPSR